MYHITQNFLRGNFLQKTCKKGKTVPPRITGTKAQSVAKWHKFGVGCYTYMTTIIFAVDVRHMSNG